MGYRYVVHISYYRAGTPLLYHLKVQPGSLIIIHQRTKDALPPDVGGAMDFLPAFCQSQRLLRQYTATVISRAARTASMASRGNVTVGDYGKYC
jgi:hypothetical protein